MWQNWLRMARASLEDAEQLRKEVRLRSSASRFYYAAYQGITALLLYSGQTPPVVDEIQRQSWAHERTPDMLVDNLIFIGSRQERNKLRSMIQDMYKTRVYADYVGSGDIDMVTIERQAKNGRRLLKIVETYLPKEQI